VHQPHTVDLSSPLVCHPETIETRLTCSSSILTTLACRDSDSKALLVFILLSSLTSSNPACAHAPPGQAQTAERRYLHRPREDGLVHPADPSRSNLADALGLAFEVA
jgi:hypothetical protein